MVGWISSLTKAQGIKIRRYLKNAESKNAQLIKHTIIYNQ